MSSRMIHLRHHIILNISKWCEYLLTRRMDKIKRLIWFFVPSIPNGIIHSFFLSLPTKVEMDKHSHINQNINSSVQYLQVGTRNIPGYIGDSHQIPCWFMQFGRLDEWPLSGFMISKLLIVDRTDNMVFFNVWTSKVYCH